MNLQTQDVEPEAWVPIEEYEMEYEISSYGRIRSLDRYVISIHGHRLKRGIILNPSITDGYYTVTLCKCGIAKTKRIHIIVAKTFHPNPENKPQVNHKNGNKLDNHKDNLEWNTAKENKHHAIYVLKAYSHGVNHHDAKINDSIVRHVRKTFADNPNINKAQLARDNGIDPRNLGKLLSGKAWRHVI